MIIIILKIYITVDLYDITGEIKVTSFVYKCSNFSISFHNNVYFVDSSLMITIKADALYINNKYIGEKNMTKKEYAKKLKDMIHRLTKMHSREYYREYCNPENLYDLIDQLLDQMENDND